MAVSMEAPGKRPAGSSCREHCLTISARSKGMKMSSFMASTIHLPDALIHRTPSSFVELLPVLACVSNGSAPIRAVSCRSRESSTWLSAGIFFLIRRLQSSFLRQDPQSLLDRRRWCGSLSPSPPNLERSFENSSNRDYASPFVSRNGRQAHGGDAPTRAAVGFTPELTGDDLGFQVR